MAPSSNTIERIYNAAEQLFAKNGFTETSLRLITAKANVNLSAVNYHFGSKQGLITAIFSRYLTSFSAELEKKLTLYEQQNSEHSVEELLSLFLELAISTKTHSAEGLVTFMRLLSAALMQKQTFIHAHFIKHFGKTFHRFVLLIENAIPHPISSVEVFWRIHFTLGSIMLTMSSFDFLQGIVKKDFSASIKISQVVRLMIPFLTAGMSAAPALTTGKLADAKFRPEN